MIPVFLSAIQIDIMSNISNCLMASDGREKVENLNNAVAVLNPNVSYSPAMNLQQVVKSHDEEGHVCLAISTVIKC
jgi:hypothetical protein